MDMRKKCIYLVLSICLFNIIKVSAITLPIEQTEINKNKFIGKWDIKTIVIDSNCPYIIVGSTTESNLEIKQTLKALWSGGKWTDSTTTIKLLNDKEAITERVTGFKTKDKDNWKAILIDHLKLADSNSMESESVVIQYKNGLVVGEYKTFSILTRQN